MIPEEKQDGPSAREESTRLQAAGSVCKGSDTLAQTQHSHLQSRRARIHQQISKELRMRAGAENLYRATSNTRVRETVALELSYVNCSLQLLKEELEELNCSVDAEGPGRAGATAPMIPLGLKDTKELDWSAALTELISRHFGEDGTSYEAEIRELADLRQESPPWGSSRDSGDARRPAPRMRWVCRSGCSVLVPSSGTLPPHSCPDGLLGPVHGPPGKSRCAPVGPWPPRGTVMPQEVPRAVCMQWVRPDRAQPAPAPQAIRTPSRSESGLELLAAYYNQLCLLDARFVTPTRSLGLLFHWYDSLTGVPAQQQALAFEKGSVLFNIGALHTQIGARQDRSCAEGAGRAAEAFQRAAGAFRLLRDKFSHAPSPDMSPAWLSTLEQLMVAQAQECVFEGLSLPGPAVLHDCMAQLHLAQEAAQVAAEYEQAHRTMAQPPVQDYVPFAWTTLVRVKAEHFRALAHYHAATALCHGSPAEAELLALEQAFVGPPAPSEPRHPTLAQEPEERRKLGKAHLKRAILGQEEALRLHGVCRALRRVDLLQAVLGQALQRSLTKYSELDLEDDFFEATEAPDIQPRTHRRPEVRAPSFSRVKVADIFHRLGPLSVFSVKNHWRLVGPVHVTRGEGGFGFTLRGDSPVLIAAVIPGGHAAAAGLQEGDYIVSVNGQPCKWWKHAEVVAQLKGVGAEGVSLQVVTLLPSAELPSTGDRRPALRGLLRSQKECSWETPAPSRASPRPLLGWSRKAQRGQPGGRLCPAPHPHATAPSLSSCPGRQ